MTLDLPSYPSSLGLLIEIQDGEEIIVLPFSPSLEGRPDYLHGGAIAGLLDFVCLRTLEGILNRDGRKARIRLCGSSVEFIRGGKKTLTHASASILHIGNTNALVTAVAWQASQAKPIALSQQRYVLEA